jgi:hypothetical protein
LSGSPESPELSVFISHRHKDAAIATVLADWIRDCAGVRIFQSSTPGDAPAPGRQLNLELRKALHDSSLVLCLFTAKHEDWSWCMWECGLAQNPVVDDTRVILLQFTDDFPDPFGDVVRVDVRSRNDIHKFAMGFLTDPQMFPGYGRPLRPDLAPTDPAVQRRARDLFDAFGEVGFPEPVEQWASWTILILELRLDEVESLDEDLSEDERVRLIKEMLMDRCVVVDGERTARNIFGLVAIPQRIRFSKLYDLWRRKYQAPESKWLDSIAGQISIAARRQIPATDWEIMEGAASGTSQSSMPVLCWTVRDPANACIQFHLYFIPVREVKPDTSGPVELGFAPPE